MFKILFVLCLSCCTIVDGEELKVLDFSKTRFHTIEQMEGIIKDNPSELIMNHTNWSSENSYYPRRGYKLLEILFTNAHFPELKIFSLNNPENVFLTSKGKCMGKVCVTTKIMNHFKMPLLDFSSFAPNLESLSLTGVHLADIEELPSSDLRELTQLNRLKFLDLSGAVFSKVNIEQTLYASLDCLEELNVSNSNVKGAHFNVFAPNLKKLTLKGTNVTGGDISKISALKKLEYLDLEFTNVSGSSLKKLKNLPELKTLILVGTNMLNANFSELHNLETLDLSYSQLSILSFESLFSLCNLKELNLNSVTNNSNILPVDINKLQEALPNCKIIK